ncbi:MAG: hypothetical protein ACRC6E_12805 [Fusobacteriaceae bacterium]
MVKFLRNIILILLPFYLLLLWLNKFFQIEPIFAVDPLVLIGEVTDYIYNKGVTNETVALILTVVTMILPSYIMLFLIFAFKGDKRKRKNKK